jgi:hypothetical protein
MANFKRKKSRWAGRITLRCKYWYKGMSKTNYREQPQKERKAFTKCPPDTFASVD